MKALVLGLGISGKSAKTFLEKKGYEVVGVDDALAPQEFSTLAGFDLFVPSPGVPRTHPLYKLAQKEKIPIKGEAQIGLENVSNPCIGITGTNGKTTVCKMVEHVLNFCGKKARAVGNVGDPLTQEFTDEILVVELSSFQLETLQAKVFDVAVLLNISEDHLDRYDSFEEYAKTKAYLQTLVKEEGEFLAHEKIDPSYFFSGYISYHGANEEAALRIVENFGISKEEFFKALKTFSKPAHRLEFVAEINKVRYYNDSKATNISAVINAVLSVEGKVVLLLGGRDKGLSFEPLAALQEKLRGVVTFGEASEKIANALQNQSGVHKVKTVKEALDIATDIAKEGEAVLFSPGCASFDAFKNYQQRGDYFKSLVQEKKL